MTGPRVVVVFDRIPALIERLPQAVKAVMDKTARDAEAVAKQRAPVDTGRLRNSITGKSAGEMAVEAEVTTDVEYAIYQEFGTYKMAAHPFMRPAFDAVTPALMAALNALGRAL